ncbi:MULTISPECIES: hypothetical protein [Phyllobacteriaceae]|jgi:hypothetical protein|uniref:hypothetical protein n=1 Tax=Phyllobacteriaceae TaxID=69277 RepID=UPI0004B184C5|nr:MULTISPECIES: hypothetical protein [Mesorhizobium]MBN9234561.1 hypothetical protein [Mesorhizobium sp.]MDQ0328960.1 hypothetical protein [Mesorhizobium sp. YL-MeA3-2017]
MLTLKARHVHSPNASCEIFVQAPAKGKTAGEPSGPQAVFSWAKKRKTNSAAGAKAGGG